MLRYFSGEDARSHCRQAGVAAWPDDLAGEEGASEERPPKLAAAVAAGGDAER